MTRFQTLLQREWMQHQRGWLLMMLVPPALIFLTVLLGPDGVIAMDIKTNAYQTNGPMVPLLTMFASSTAITALVLMVAVIAVGFQAPGQARRDHQDRSIEFWLSMPVSHSASIGAMLLMQLFLVPQLALALGWLSSQFIGLAAVARLEGVAAWATLPWGPWLTANLSVLARLSMGLVLAALWFSPLVMLSMAASAWLRRWGVPAVFALVVGGGLMLKRLYGATWIFDTLDRLMMFGRNAFIHIDRHAGVALNVHVPQELLLESGRLPPLMLQDGLAALRDCGEPLFWGAQLFSLACFGLLVLRRRRGA